MDHVGRVSELSGWIVVGVVLVLIVVNILLWGDQPINIDQMR